MDNCIHDIQHAYNQCEQVIADAIDTLSMIVDAGVGLCEEISDRVIQL